MSNFNILNFGANQDKESLNTEAIQKAIDSAYEEGGGTVIIPPGQFKAGTIYLKSKVTLKLENGATLAASTEMKHFEQIDKKTENKDRQPYHFLVFDEVEDVTICGDGKIDGQGESFWHPRSGPGEWYKEKDKRVSPMIEVVNSKNIKFKDFTITNSPGWTCHFNMCDSIYIRGIRILNDLLGPNTDGLDINGCHDVIVSDCHIETGDDAIVLKTTPDSRTCERVIVTNCDLRTNCVGFKLGANESYHDMREITFSNSVVHKSSRAFGLYCLHGGTLENVSVNNIVCNTDNGMILNRPIHFDLRRKTDDARMGKIRNIQVSNFTAKTKGRILMTAEDGGQLENITLRDIHLSFWDVEDAYNIEHKSGSSQFSNRSKKARQANAAVVGDNIKNLVIENLAIDWPDETKDFDFHVLWGRNLKGGYINSSMVTPYKDDLKIYKFINSDIQIKD
ncbi:MAG: glycoside hydrolase family 28 protein [bacterium]